MKTIISLFILILPFSCVLPVEKYEDSDEFKAYCHRQDSIFAIEHRRIDSSHKETMRKIDSMHKERMKQLHELLK